MNGTTADKKAAEEIKAIVVNPDDVIEMMRRNARDRNEQRTHVLRISPPFETMARATPHSFQQGNYYPPETDPKPIHLGAGAFFGDADPHHVPDECARPDRNDERALFRHDNSYEQPLDDEQEQEFEEWWDTVLGMWEEDAMSKLRREVDISSQYADEPIIVDVDY